MENSQATRTLPFRSRKKIADAMARAIDTEEREIVERTLALQDDCWGKGTAGALSHKNNPRKMTLTRLSELRCCSLSFGLEKSSQTE